MNNFASFLQENSIEYDHKISLKKRTWIKRGGVVDYWVKPTSIAQLTILVSYLNLKNIDYEVVGATSNIYFMDSYNTQIIISTLKIKGVEKTDSQIKCECGVQVASLARECVDLGVTGFSGLVNLPGTVAAAVCNNSGCFGSCISDQLEYVLVYKNGGVEKLSFDDMQFSHRSSVLKRKERSEIILYVVFKRKQAEDVQKEKENANRATNIRKTIQEKPLLNLGSVYSHLSYRKNLKYYLVLAVKGIVLITSSRAKAVKSAIDMQVKQYGYEDIRSYISDKNINTFIWKDEKSVDAFERYKGLMSKIFINPISEIEIKG